ncbi:MAG: amino acid ABC transporter substrate-binding protein [Rhodocyclales bacterium GT-UBC]|nr:MAG: amino acid ABC transporter substrate-binding protein [Rhodocyclales bacterium GT-UBC]
MKLNRLAGLVWAATACFFSCALAQPGGDSLGATLTRISTREAVYLGYRETAQPFSFLLAGQDKPQGFAWDLCEEVIQVVQQRLGKNIHVVPVPVTESARVMMVKSGMIDLDCSGGVNSVARQKQVAMSNTIFVGEHRVMVRRGSGIERFEQLADKRVAVLNAGQAERFVRQAALGRNISLQLLSVNSPVEAMTLLLRGDVDAFVGEDVMLAIQRAAQQADLVLLEGGLAAEPYALMFAKDDASFKKLVDETLVAMMQSGLFARVYDKWFVLPSSSEHAALGLPMSPLLKAAVQAPNDKPVN